MVDFVNDYPRSTPAVLRRGLSMPVAVWALQRCLNSLQWTDVILTEDGDFGPSTEAIVKRYQAATDLVADGVVGPVTQARLAKSCRYRADQGHMPAGLLDAIILGESAGYIAAVNLTVAGGVDVGFTQRRVYEPYAQAAMARGFDSLYQIQLLHDNLLDRFKDYYAYRYVTTRPDRSEFAWRLAVLHHNWPYGASRLAQGYQLSTTRATWVPVGTQFEDGELVLTFRDWAKFYAMGSNAHSHRGHMVRSVFGVPRDG